MVWLDCVPAILSKTTGRASASWTNAGFRGMSGAMPGSNGSPRRQGAAHAYHPAVLPQRHYGWYGSNESSGPASWRLRFASC